MFLLSSGSIKGAREHWVRYFNCVTHCACSSGPPSLHRLIEWWAILLSGQVSVLNNQFLKSRKKKLKKKNQTSLPFVLLFVVASVVFFKFVIQPSSGGKGRKRCTTLDDRAIFSWESKIISCLLMFYTTMLCDWSAKLTPLSQPIGSKTKTKRNFFAYGSRVFPRLK